MSLPIEKSSSDELAREVARRRTFAIISHPDAGKTTLTEKLLLYAGAVHLAGAVQARSHQRAAKSDWMELEQARGISITSTALQFDYEGVRVNLLDTPGHQDFSEDTYRTLMAVDSAVMVLDCAKGIEPQTKKLFAVCRKRNIPIMTFINKMDLPGRHPYELLEEIEQTLGMTAVPFNWPIGEGSGFQGLYDLQEPQVLFFQRTLHNQRRAPMRVETFPHPSLAETLGEAYGPLQEEIALLTGAGTKFDRRPLSRRPTHAGLLRERADELRRRAISERLPPARATAGTAHELAGADAADRRQVLRLCVQDSGEHGPATSRSDGVFAYRVGPLREGYDGLSCAAGPEDPDDATAPALRP